MNDSYFDMFNMFAQNEFAKEEQSVIATLQSMKRRGYDMRPLMWRMLSAEESDECIDNESEEKKSNESETGKDTQKPLSLLIDTTAKEMCVFGHSNFQTSAQLPLKQCVQCGSDKNLEYCWDCVMYELYTILLHIRRPV